MLDSFASRLPPILRRQYRVTAVTVLVFLGVSTASMPLSFRWISWLPFPETMLIGAGATGLIAIVVQLAYARRSRRRVLRMVEQTSGGLCGECGQILSELRSDAVCPECGVPCDEARLRGYWRRHREKVDASFPRLEAKGRRRRRARGRIFDALMVAFAMLLSFRGSTSDLIRLLISIGIIAWVITLLAAGHHVFRVYMERRLVRRLERFGSMLCRTCGHDLLGPPPSGTCPLCHASHDLDTLRAEWDHDRPLHWVVDMRAGEPAREAEPEEEREPPEGDSLGSSGPTGSAANGQPT